MSEEDKQRLLEDNIRRERPNFGISQVQNAIVNSDYGESSGFGSTCSYESNIISEKANVWPQHIAAITATISAIASGMVLGWTSPISDALEASKYRNITVTEVQMGWIGSLGTIGGMLACVPYGLICDLIGRRLALLLLVVPFSIGWSFLVWAESLLMLYVGRFVTGVAAGACCVVAPIYTCEIAQKEVRGTLGSYFQLMITIGIFAAYILGRLLHPYVYTACCACVPLIFFLMFLPQPESPVYELKRGRIASATTNLQRLRGNNYNPSAEIASIQLTLQNEKQNDNGEVAPTASCCSSLRRAPVRRALLIALALMLFQQFCGVNAIIFYTSEIFEAAGSKMDPRTASIFVGGFQVCGTLAASLIIDRLGRRVLLITSQLIMTMATIALGVYFSMKERHLVTPATLLKFGYLPIVALCVFMLVFALGMGPIPWMISGEIFTPEMKGVGGSTAATLNWFLAFLITKFYLQMESALGADLMFYLFSGASLIGALFTFFIIPETKGKTMEQIQVELDD